MESLKEPLNKPKLIIIVGPTASGKSALAITLAQKSNGEIVSADSRQIYRGMDIGTAKPPLVERKMRHEKRKKTIPEDYPCLVSQENIRHYLIDIKNPNEEYTVAQYKKDAIKAIGKIIKRGKLPILVGGTGLYVKAVVDNLEIPEVKPNPALRKKLEKRIEKEGLEKLFQELVELDPEAAYIVDGKNPRRVIRALEIALTTKKPFSAQRKKGKPLFDALTIGITLPQKKLREKIETRVDEMIKSGLVNEIKNLVKKYGSAPTAFDAIGYREIINYLAADKRRLKPQINADNNIRVNPRINQHKSAYGFEEAVKDIKKNTWAFAKRQMTWFKKDREIKWVGNEKEALALVKKFLLKM